MGYDLLLALELTLSSQHVSHLKLLLEYLLNMTFSGTTEDYILDGGQTSVSLVIDVSSFVPASSLKNCVGKFSYLDVDLRGMVLPAHHFT